MFAQFNELQVGLISTIHKLVVLEHINFLVVIAEIGIDELVVIGFTQVQHTLETAIDIFCYL